MKTRDLLPNIAHKRDSLEAFSREDRFRFEAQCIQCIRLCCIMHE